MAATRGFLGLRTAKEKRNLKRATPEGGGQQRRGAPLKNSGGSSQQHKNGEGKVNHRGQQPENGKDAKHLVLRPRNVRERKSKTRLWPEAEPDAQ